MTSRVLALLVTLLSKDLVLCRNFDHPTNPGIIPPSEYEQLPVTSDYAANDARDQRSFDESRNENEVSSSDFDSQKEIDDWQNSVPGVPGKDYPNLKKIPRTSFSCSGKKVGGYYADVETGCQVFHVCNARGVKSSFLCSPGSIFNQKYFVCDWWYDVECANALDLYSLNEHLSRAAGHDPEVTSSFNEVKYQTQNYPNYLQKDYQDNSNSIDLSLAGTGEGASGYKNNTLQTYQTNASNYRQNDVRRDFSSSPIKDWNHPEPRESNDKSSLSFRNEVNSLEDHRLFDNVPRGFSKNNEGPQNFFDDQRREEFSSESSSALESEFQPGIIYSGEDELDRRIQKEVDDTVLYKNTKEPQRVENPETFDDYEANQLTYERPPPQVESYYSRYQAEPETLLPPRKNNFDGGNGEGPSPSGFRIRPTGGLKDGLGNGFPSTNRELAGSNAIAGINESKSSLGQRPDYPAFDNQHVPHNNKF